ncbi:hypothetical protein AVEN_166850-1 [Araneus ventricosus]|uniref:Uncharacterized protein n=1 Tax=Araneus ventricosus TaxID=182803 RepID=A0A4Y2H9L3_ARAVE|nr:hypothetical protein AVEN_166850-1 [Araneus ventricosus]
MYVAINVLFDDVSVCIGHNGAGTSTTILRLSGPSKEVTNEQMEEVRAVLKNDSSTTTSLIEDFPKNCISKDISEEISPLSTVLIKIEKGEKSVQVKR